MPHFYILVVDVKDKSCWFSAMQSESAATLSGFSEIIDNLMSLLDQ